MTNFSFFLGFGTSRYLIDRTLREASALLQQSAQEYQREQTTLMRQFQIDYRAVELKLAVIQPGGVNR